MGICRRIEKLNPKLQERLKAFLKECETQNINVAILETVRSEEVQKAYYAQCGRVQVVKHDGLTVELAQKLGAGHILRGVRSVQDYAYELQMADVNRRLSGVDTVLLPALPQLACLSSSVVRELAHFGRRWQDMLPDGLQYHINM